MNLHTTIDLLANRKLHNRYTFQGMNISIENRKGSIRSGTDKDGNKWESKMPYDYGYIRLSEGADGDHVDCFIGPDEKAKKVYIVHINDPGTDKYDEDKCFLGFSSRKQAINAFKAAYDKPDKFYGSMTVMSIEKFKSKVVDKNNYGKKLQAIAEVDWGTQNFHMDPIPTFRAPKSGLSRVPTDDPGETDDRFLDVTKRKQALKDRLRLLTNKGVPMGVHSTYKGHHMNDGIYPLR